MTMTRRNLHVTASIAFHGWSGMLRRAVESLLLQTHSDLTVVVVNDGGSPPWDLLADLDDPRLVRFDLSSNRGCYFAHAVALNAAAGPYFAIQDADDWSEPQRIATLLDRLRATSAVAAVSASLLHTAPSSPPCGQIGYPGAGRRLPPWLVHWVDHHGLFRSAALQALGGYFGGFRIGYDTLLMSFLRMTGRIAWVEEPLYHRILHQDSLTAAPVTGYDSAARRQAAAEMAWMYAEAFAVYRRARPKAADRRHLCAEIRRIVRRRVSPGERIALAGESRRLAQVLADHRSTRPKRVSLPLGMSPRSRAEGLGVRTAVTSRGTGLAVGILSSGRLPRRTLQALRTACPGLQERSFSFALIQDGDPETFAYEREDVGHILLLEDGWVMRKIGADECWLPRARKILDDFRGVGQVRLSYTGEPIPSRHTVTGRPVRWHRRRGFLLSTCAPFTFAPSLIRAADVAKVFPCPTEEEARQRFLKTGLATAQLLPGVFRRIGRRRGPGGALPV
jgi:Glycosyl transferase family 2